MYLVGLHIYYKMIHGPYNIKSLHISNFMHFLEAILCGSSSPLLSALDVFYWVNILLHFYFIVISFLLYYIINLFYYYLFHIELSVTIYLYKNLTELLQLFQTGQIKMLHAAVKSLNKLEPMFTLKRTLL